MNRFRKEELRRGRTFEGREPSEEEWREMTKEGNGASSEDWNEYLSRSEEKEELPKKDD